MNANNVDGSVYNNFIAGTNTENALQYNLGQQTLNNFKQQLELLKSNNNNLSSKNLYQQQTGNGLSTMLLPVIQGGGGAAPTPATTINLVEDAVSAAGSSRVMPVFNYLESFAAAPGAVRNARSNNVTASNNNNINKRQPTTAIVNNNKQ